MATSQGKGEQRAGIRPFAWERSYPPGLRWNAAIETSSLGDLLDRAVAKFGPRTAIEFENQTISYAVLGGFIDALAAGLHRIGLGGGKPVALLLPNTPTHPVAFFAAAKLGVTAVHLSPLDSERTAIHKLTDSGARMLITSNHASLLTRALKMLAAGHVDWLIVADDARWGTPEAVLVPIPIAPNILRLSDLLDQPPLGASFPPVDPESIALLQYTGGTTGLPKGAMLTHRNLTAAIGMYDVWNRGQGVPWPETERIICVLPLFHIFALSTILLRGLKNGAEILLRSRFDVEAALADVEVGRATGLPGVPTMWIAIVNHPGLEHRDLSSLVLFSSGGAPLPVELADRFQALTGFTLRNGWGMTETSPAGTNNPRHLPPKPGSIGIPLPQIEMDVVALNDPSRVLPPGEIGEIRIKGPNVSAGYWNRPDATATAFIDERFLTGDIGTMDEDGYFFLVDRKTDMIISGGYNVYPQMIEQAIYEHPSVEEALVVGVPDAYRGEQAKAFVKLKAGSGGLTLDALQAFLADKLGRHEMPQLLEIRDALPRTPVGKLSKTELREEERARAKRER